MPPVPLLFPQILNRASGFLRDERGTFATTLGVAVLGVTLCAGIAFDYSRISRAQSAMDDALDSAILAVGNQMTNGVTSETQLRTEFDDFLFGNLQARGLEIYDIRVADFAIDLVSGKIKGEAQADLPLSFLKLTGRDSYVVDSLSEATFSMNSVEVAMVLDVTGSMGGSKINALKSAAADAVDILIPEVTASTRVRIGLVPYSGAVNPGKSFASAASDGISKKCVTERSGPLQHTDASYLIDPVKDATTKKDKCPSNQIRLLTNDRDLLISDIADFETDGYTAGHIGIAWSYYMLSENWNSLWPLQNKAANYEDDVLKVAIIMTDGEFNTYYDGVPYKKRNNQVSKSNNAAIALCNDMKADKGSAKGIVVYSIAFKAPKSAKTTLKACANPDSGGSTFYYDADNDAELRSAFQSIASDIQKLRLSN